MKLPSCDTVHTVAEIADALTDAEYRSIRGHRSQARRQKRSGGRKCIPTDCPACGATQPSRKLAREHCVLIDGVGWLPADSIKARDAQQIFDKCRRYLIWRKGSPHA